VSRDIGVLRAKVSDGWWLMPPLPQRTNSMPIAVICPMTIASWPAPLGRPPHLGVAVVRPMLSAHRCCILGARGTQRLPALAPLNLDLPPGGERADSATTLAKPHVPHRIVIARISTLSSQRPGNHIHRTIGTCKLSDCAIPSPACPAALLDGKYDFGSCRGGRRGADASARFPRDPPTQ